MLKYRSIHKFINVVLNMLKIFKASDQVVEQKVISKKDNTTTR